MATTSPRLKRNARAMRRSPTRAEARIWSWLRSRRCGGFKFRRQVPIGRYIVDFYCAELKLVIELDGAHHRTSWMGDYDGTRTRELEAHGICVVRIPNELLIRDSILVGQMIDATIAELARPPHPPSAPSPPHAGEKDLEE